MSRSPLLIGVTELRRRPGTQREVQLRTTLPELAITTASVAEDAELALDVTLEAVEGGITVLGHLDAPWTGECRRCLEPVHGELSLDISEVFEARPTPGETYPISGDDVDLEPVVRDAVLLALPLAPLCREDCLGPAPEAFPAVPTRDLVEEEGGDRLDGPPKDPRWAVLDVLRADPD